ncbi:Mitogen-activated protein kinase kinase kinase 1 [Bienertia sinuspersici]
MEPTYSIAPPPDHHHERQQSSEYQPTQAFTDRILRALGHRLLLLYRSDPNFYVLGATGNVYVVNVSTTLACTCPDRATPCKHILFVLIKVLGLPLDEPCLRKRTLRPSHLARILANPSLPDSFASSSLRQIFYQEFFLQREHGGSSEGSCGAVVEEGATCPICLEEMGKSGKKLVACGTCRNSLHEECLMTWKRTQRRRMFNCVICRARWKDRVEQERYLNLAAYVNEDAHMGPEAAGSGACHE